MAPPAAGSDYEISERLSLQAVSRPPGTGYDSSRVRRLQIYTLDPSVSSLLGGTATVDVPYEPLRPGPIGSMFEIDSELVPDVLARGSKGKVTINLDDQELLLRNGLAPTPADGRFHLQMTYAVCSLTYNAFQRALGREILWASGRQDGRNAPFRLRVSPFALKGQRNASFDQEVGAISFGYFEAPANPGGHTPPRGMVSTALSHDVIVHETSHALLHALRAQFAIPSNPDVLGFHEGFADIVALLMHFTYPDVVFEAMRASKGSLAKATLLTDLARQFGQATSDPANVSALRTALDVATSDAFDSDAIIASNSKGSNEAPLQYSPDLEAHRMGSVLVSAVFEAFTTVLRRRSLRYFRIAGLAPGSVTEAELTDDLVRALASEATATARHFLDICIRAIDYCPPVDMRLGEYLRALITADMDVVKDDRYCYREALMRSFQRRGIFPEKLQFMSADAVCWDTPKFTDVIRGLSLRDLRFDADLTRPAGKREMLRRAHALGKFVTQKQIARALHLIAPGAAPPRNVRHPSPIRIESIRTTRRTTDDGRMTLDLVAEVTQSCTVTVDGTLMDFSGGCTLIIDSQGRVRYAVYKKMDSSTRPKEQHAAATGQLKGFWDDSGDRLVPRPNVLKRLHEQV
jgi:hypothetical protein